MSTPSRGSRNAKDPISLDSSDDDIPNQSQAGPSQRSQPRRSISSTRRASVPQAGTIVDLTNDSGSDTALPNSKPPSLTRKSRTIPSSQDLKYDQHAAGPSRKVKQEIIGKPGSWTNPTALQPPSSDIQYGGSSSSNKGKELEAPSGSWLNPTPLVPRPIITSSTTTGNTAEEGSWLNPTPLEPPRTLPPTADFELPEAWIDQSSSSTTSDFTTTTPLLHSSSTASDFTTTTPLLHQNAGLSGSWTNPAPLELRQSTATSITGNEAKEGSWLNPTLLEPPNSLPLTADFELPESWTKQSSLSELSTPRTATPLQQQNVEPSGSWSNPTPLLPSTSSSTIVAEPEPSKSLELDTSGSWIDSTLKLFAPPQPDPMIPEEPIEFEPIITDSTLSTGPPAIDAPGSWANPQSLQAPIIPVQPSEPELGSWSNPAPLQPTTSYKRSPSPTELSKEDSATRKGKTRRMDSPMREVQEQVEVVTKVPEPVKPVKKGPSWVTSEQPVVKKPQPITKSQEPVSVVQVNYPPQAKEPTPMVKEKTPEDIVMEEAERTAAPEATASVSQHAPMPSTQPADLQADIITPDTRETATVVEVESLEVPREDSAVLEVTPMLGTEMASSETPLSEPATIPSAPIDTSSSSVITPSTSVTDGHTTTSSPLETSNESITMFQQSSAPTASTTSYSAAVAVSTNSDQAAIVTEQAITLTADVIPPQVPEDIQVDGIPFPGNDFTQLEAEPSPQPQPSIEVIEVDEASIPSVSVSQSQNNLSPRPEIPVEDSVVMEAIPVPQTPDISMPQTPSTSDSQEVEAELTSMMISPIAEFNISALPNNQIQSSPSPAPPIEIANHAGDEHTIHIDDPLPESQAGPATIASPVIEPLPTVMSQPTPEPESRDELALQNSPVADIDIKPIIPSLSQWKISSGPGMSSTHPIEFELDDDDLDCLNSDKESEGQGNIDVAVEKEVVETVRVGVDEVEITPLPQESAIDMTQSSPSSSVLSIEEIKSDEFIPKIAGLSRQVPGLVPEIPRIKLRVNGKNPSSPKAASSSLSPPKSISPEPKFEVVIPTRSRSTWRWIVEHGGESEIEDALDSNSDGPPSSGPSNSVEMVEHNGFTIRKSYRISLKGKRAKLSENFDGLVEPIETQVHTILSEAIPDPLPPLNRIGRANRILNTKLIDEWNKRKPHLTKNPSLHRAVFEAYMAQSTSIDEPQADEIKVVNDIDGEGAPPDFEFQYSNDMLYNPDVPDPELGIGCDCDGPCNSNNQNCSCVRRQELYFYDLGMKGFAYDDKGKIREASVSVWECGKNCGCPPECQNRVIQRGRGKDTKIELFKTKWKGWGIRARAPIAAGTFLGIYAGELITEQESEERGRLYAQIGRTYLFDCDGWQIAHPPPGLAKIDPRSAKLAQLAAERAKIAAKEADDPSYVYSAYSVDAFHYGFTRYFNHSCDPNLAITQAYVKDFHPERPILVIFARRPINRNEELCISYKGIPDDDEIPIPIPQPKLTTRNAKQKKSKTSASAHITGTAKGKMADKDRCMCKTARCDGRMFNYGG